MSLTRVIAKPGRVKQTWGKKTRITKSAVFCDSLESLQCSRMFHFFFYFLRFLFFFFFILNYYETLRIHHSVSLSYFHFHTQAHVRESIRTGSTRFSLPLFRLLRMPVLVVVQFYLSSRSFLSLSIESSKSERALFLSLFNNLSPSGSLGNLPTSFYLIPPRRTRRFDELSLFLFNTLTTGVDLLVGSHQSSF